MITWLVTFKILRNFAKYCVQELKKLSLGRQKKRKLQ